MDSNCTILSCLKRATNELRPSESARLDAELLLSDLLNVSRTGLYTHEKRNISAGQNEGFFQLIKERRRGKPVSYILGKTEFWSLPLTITSDVLIPRPETETLVETVVKLTKDKKKYRVLELGTGSGAVAAALQTEMQDAQVIATDISLPALRVARSNFTELGLNNIKTAVGNWLEPIGEENFDFIVANPPYIGKKESNLLDREVFFEPSRAIFSGEDGLDAITVIVRDAYRCLRDGGVLALEHGYRQGKIVQKIFELNGFTGRKTIKDLGDKERVTYGVKT